MKNLFFIVLFVFSALVACNSPEAEREREGLRDNNPGVGAFRRASDDKLEDEDPEEEDEDCREYNGGGFSILGDVSPFQWAQNCIAYQIDKSLAPICEEERDVREALRDCEGRCSDEEIEIWEEHLSAIEDQKYEIADGIYAMADESSNISDELHDKVDSSEKWGGSSRPIKRIFGSALNMLIDSEVGGFTRVLDSRARMACRGTNFELSRIPSRR